jgi:N-acetylglutamate synthase-like GNAT family acetyltransferase
MSVGLCDRRHSVDDRAGGFCDVNHTLGDGSGFARSPQGAIASLRRRYEDGAMRFAPCAQRYALPCYLGCMGYELVKVTTEGDWREYHSLRRDVLWDARGRTGYDEKHPDEYLPANYPLLLKLDGRPIGTTRLDDLGDRRGVVRLVTIAADVQRRGHGRILSALVEDYACRLGLKTLLVNAAPDAVGYYKKMGWHACVWDEAELTGIASDCEQMTKSLVQMS